MTATELTDVRDDPLPDRTGVNLGVTPSAHQTQMVKTVDWVVAYCGRSGGTVESPGEPAPGGEPPDYGPDLLLCANQSYVFGLVPA
jgi:hypothetical protein